MTMELREIDIEVHRKVFGNDTEEIPHYSSDWNDFGNLLVAVYDKWGCGVRIEMLHPAVDTKRRWLASITGGKLGYDNGDCMVAVRDTEPELAFCKAVLKLKPLTDEEIATLESESGD